MDTPPNDQASQNDGLSYDSLRALKHEIKNQLSNVYLALEQLKYEIPEPTADCLFYIETISVSATKINSLLSETDQR